MPRRKSNVGGADRFRMFRKVILDPRPKPIAPAVPDDGYLEYLSEVVRILPIPLIPEFPHREACEARHSELVGEDEGPEVVA